jgi:hypothetical protein
MNWSEQVVLVTGGTGSFGKKFVEIMLREYQLKESWDVQPRRTEATRDARFRF